MRLATLATMRLAIRLRLRLCFRRLTVYLLILQLALGFIDLIDTLDD